MIWGAIILPKGSEDTVSLSTGRPPRPVLAALVAALIYGTLWPLGASAGNAQATVTVLCAQSQALLDAVAPGDKAPWQKYLDEQVNQVDEIGVLRRKPEILAELTPLPPGLIGRIATDKYTVVVDGDAANVALELQEHLDYHGQLLQGRFRVAETWRRRPDGWRLLGQFVAAALRAPPAMPMAEKALCMFAGKYELTEELRTTLRCTSAGLVAERPGRPNRINRAEVLDVFFVPGEPRTLRILMPDAQGRISGFVDRRESEHIK